MGRGQVPLERGGSVHVDICKARESAKNVTTTHVEHTRPGLGPSIEAM